MAEPHTTDMISEGWDVYDSDGERIGSVQEVTSNWIEVDGDIGEHLYVPLTAVEAAAGGRVSLDTPGSGIPAMGWDEPPAESRTDELLEDREAT